MARIFVGNLDFSAVEDEIRSLFQGYGTVDDCFISRDRNTGRSMGFGFVEMPDLGEAETAARSLSGHVLHGRPMMLRIVLR